MLHSIRSLLEVPLLRTLAAVALALVLPAAASARGPSTPAERKRAVETTRRLEREPLARGSDEARATLLQWIVDIPDINVTTCSGPLDALASDEEESPYAKVLYIQPVFGMAAFKIENPKKADDWVAVQTAGIESALRAYESIRRADSAARFEVLDHLLAARKAGKLRQIVEKEMARCGKPQGQGEAEEIPPDAI